LILFFEKKGLRGVEILISGSASLSLLLNCWAWNRVMVCSLSWIFSYMRIVLLKMKVIYFYR